MQSSYIFRKNIKDSFARAHEEQTILFFMLSDWVYALFIPSSYRYTPHETSQIALEIQQNILPGKHPNNCFKIFTWQEVVNSNQYWRSPYSAWAAARTTQVVFFVDQKATDAALESLWLGQELKCTRKQQSQRSEQRNKMIADLGSNQAVELCLASGFSIDEWKQKLRPVDLVNLTLPAQISLRSSDYLKTWPAALVKKERGCLWVVEVMSGNSYRPVLIDSPRQDDFLYNHYRLSAQWQTYLRSFSAQIYIHEDPELFGAVLVGEQIASIAAFPDLIAGALKTFNPYVKQIRVKSFCEDVLLLIDPGSPDELLAELMDKSNVLLKDQNQDGLDRLEYDQIVELPSFPCGDFVLKDIPGPYFDLVVAAEDAKTALPPGRAEYLRGLSYELIQSWSKAAELFRVAYRYNFSDGDINHALGRSLVEVGQFDEAIVFLERAHKLLPEDPDIANGLGVAYLESGRKDNATSYLERAVELSPDDAQFLANLGRCYFSGKRFGEAESILNRALEYAPNFSEAHATLAQVKWRLGDLPTARKHARKAFAANPGSQYMRDLLWALTVDER